MALTKVTGAGVEGLSLSSSSTALSIDSNGQITKPLQPAFLVENNNAQNNLAIDSVVTIVLDTERFDQNADFSSNTFTSPVTGRYQLQFALTLRNLDSAADYIRFRLGTSNKSYDLFVDPNFDSSSPDYDSTFQIFSASILVDMDANDTCTLGYYQAGGTAQSDLNGSEVFFSGYLVC